MTAPASYMERRAFYCKRCRQDKGRDGFTPRFGVLVCATCLRQGYVILPEYLTKPLNPQPGGDK